MARLMFACVLLGWWPAAAVAQDLDPGPTIVIGVVEEGAAPGSDVVTRVEAELGRLLRRHTVVFKRDPAFQAGWDPARMRPAVQAALDDREVDIVLVVGALASQAAGQVTRTKPVVTTFIQRPDLFDIHQSTNDQAVDSNLVIVSNPLRADSELRQLLALVPVDTVALAIEAAYVSGLTSLAAEVAMLEAALGITVLLWPVDPATQPDSAPPGVKAVALGPTPRLAPVQRQARIELLTSFGLPSYSLEGLQDVEAGALMTRTPDQRTQQARRVALNLSELIRGTGTSVLPVFLSVDPALYLNGTTAAQIGYSPRLSTLVQATILNEADLRLAETPLDLPGVQSLVQDGNVSLAIVTQEVETSRKNRQLSLSPLLPQIVAVPNYRAFDPQGLEGLVADQALNLSFQASQMIYDDQRVSNYRTSKRLEERSHENVETRRLDVVGSAGEAYLDLVLARILYRVNVENLNLTIDNLALARHRLQTGYSGPNEVFRWEAEVAKRRGDVLRSQALAEQQRIGLNQILGVDQTIRWRTREIQVDTTNFFFAGIDLNALLTTRQQLAAFRNSMVEFALMNAPELRSVGKTIEAQSIQVGQRKRSWFLPSFYLNFDYQYQAFREPELPGISRSRPVFSIQAVYPLFIGAERAFAVGQTQSQLTELTQQEKLTRQLVERRTRGSIRRLESSYPNIRLTQIQSDRARRNLMVVQDKYAQGLLNVTDLLEAQNENFAADQGAAASNYLFLIDLNAFERSIAWFENEQTPEAQAEFVDRVRQGLTPSLSQ
jgi:outer membrane protein TolC